MEDNMVKLDEILEAVKYKEAAKKKEEKKTCILWILAIIGIAEKDRPEYYGIGGSKQETLTMILRTRIWTRKNLKKKLPKRKKRTKDRGDVPLGADRSRFLSV